MASNSQTQELMTPDERRARLRAFADRMLICAENMAPPEDIPEVERFVRVATLIERLYARLHGSEVKAPALAGEHLMNRLKLQEDKQHVRWQLKNYPKLKPAQSSSVGTAEFYAPLPDDALYDDELRALHALLMPAPPQTIFQTTPLRQPPFANPENPLRQRHKPAKRALSGLPPSCPPPPSPHQSP